LSVELFAIIGVIFISLLLITIFFIPSEKKFKKKKIKPEINLTDELRDMEQKVLRLDKHIQSLRSEILEYKNKEKANDKQLMIERVKMKKLQEKLSQERQWHEKEQGSIDKKGKEFQQCKSDLIEAQESFSKEHSANIRNEQKIKELEQGNSSLTDQRRKVESENNQLSTKVESYRKEIAQLKRENIQLEKKNNDVSWIAKTEYDRVVNQLKEKEKQLERLNRENKE